MGKARKNKQPRADAVYAKKSVENKNNSNPFALAKPTTSKKLNPFESSYASKHDNPFERHVNKEKFQILGRICKHDKGLPGVSRAKAAKRRKETLGVEYLEKHKNNKFRDRRIGRFETEPSEEILNARFVAEKLSQLKGNKASKFDLNDDETLTHRGTTLEEIEKFRDERSDDEDEEGDRLDADFTEAAHFGGDGNGDGQEKDRKAAIDEMIVEQKKRKLEIAKEKDELHDLTAKLDSNYKELLGIIGKMNKKGDSEKPVQDDFDKLMREMIFEPRSEVSDKLESIEEVAKKEKARLEKLERERLKRMQGDDDDDDDDKAKNKPKHRSADDLDDGYFATAVKDDEEDDTLRYNEDGELSSAIKLKGATENDNGEDNAGFQNNKGDAEEEEEVDSDESSEADDDSEDDLSDLKCEESDEENETEPKQKSNQKRKSKETRNTNEYQESALPYTIEMPIKYENFHSLISKHNAADQATIMERLIKCNHPKLDGVNREKVVKLFAFSMEYINELFGEATSADVVQHFILLDQLNPHLYDLVQLNAERMANTMLDIIKEKYVDYQKHPKMFPTLETLVFFKLISNFFTTSDFRHPIVTPTFIFIENVLQRARVRRRQNIAIGLFLVSIVLEYTHQSKRFLPSAYNFLLGTIFLCVPKRAVEVLKITPPFQSKGPLNSLLTLNEEESSRIEKDSDEQLLNSEDLLTEDLITIDFKVRTLNTCLKLITESIIIIADNVGSNFMAQPFLNLFERIPIERYPSCVQKSFETTKQKLVEVSSKPLKMLVPPEKKPKALRLLEPRFEAVYDDKRRPKMTEAQVEKVKLLHKIKRETKGAVRELRRDTEFIQKMRIQQQMQSDAERREKVKRILHEASIQQGELNELARAKKKKKF